MNFIAFSSFLGDMAGQVFVFFILTVAAAESAIGLAILGAAVPQRRLDRRRGHGASSRASGWTCRHLYLARAAGAARRRRSSSACSARSSAARRRIGCASSASRSRCVASYFIWGDVRAGHVFNGDIYTWLQSGSLKLSIGFLIDPLTATMMLVVTFVSLMVHIYTIGYMADDDGYTRFFSYISLFTFAMLMLVMSNNFVQLFFGWEAVGLVSYLLIGFWYTRPTAIYANLKAFLANRVGDFGFVLGIGLVLRALRHAPTTRRSSRRRRRSAGTTINLWGAEAWSVLSVICICLFIGAMGKSAQVPLHVWLPDSMEGPTPDLRADPRRDDGDGRHLHGGADEPAVRAVGHRAVVRHDHRRRARSSRDPGHRASNT